MSMNNRYKKKLKSTYWHKALMGGHMQRAQNAKNPGYLRLADLAIAFAGANGHAEFGRGELTRFLGSDHRAVNAAIKLAKTYGLLAEGSCRRCLQIPLNQFETCATGAGIDQQKAQRLAPCPTCTKVPRRPAVCHPGRERYTSIEAGGLCQSCHRRRSPAGSSITGAECVDGDEAFASLVAQGEPDPDYYEPETAPFP